MDGLSLSGHSALRWLMSFKETEGQASWRSWTGLFCHVERRLLSEGCCALESIRELLSGSVLPLSNYVCTHEFACLSASPWLRQTVTNIR